MTHAEEARPIRLMGRRSLARAKLQQEERKCASATPTHATPDELRARAKDHMAKWRELLPTSPVEAREHLETASNLSLLAAEADEAKAKSAAMGRQGE